MSSLTALLDTDDPYYTCTFTCDANGNITNIVENSTVNKETATLTTSYSYDSLNRLTRHETELYDSSQGDTQLTQRDHGYNAAGQLARSGYRQYWESDTPPGFDELEHVYSRGKLLTNTDASGNGEVRRSTPLGEASSPFAGCPLSYPARPWSKR